MSTIDSASNVSRLLLQSEVANEPKTSATKTETKDEASPSTVVHLSGQRNCDEGDGYGHLSDKKYVRRAQNPAYTMRV